MESQPTPEEYRRKWGVPDWRDVRAYPLNLSDDLWRWEFLRRRDDYRIDWQEWAQKFAENHGRRDAAEVVALEPKAEKYHMWFLLDPVSAEPEWCAFWNGDPDEGWRGAGRWAPSELHPPSGWYRVFQPGILYLPGPTDCTAIEDGHCVVVIDRSKPLEAQLRGIHKAFVKSAKGVKTDNLRRRHYKAWRTYLRVLDARAEGEKWHTIWDVISPNHHLTRNEAAARAFDLHKKALKISALSGSA